MEIEKGRWKPEQRGQRKRKVRPVEKELLQWRNGDGSKDDGKKRNEQK